MTNMARFGCALVLMGFSCGCHGSQDYAAINKEMNPRTGFVRYETSFGPRQRVYTVFIPNDYTPAKHYPTILFLHGWLQGGTGGVSALDSGIGPYVIRHKMDFPFIVIFPQSTDGQWQDPADQDDAIRTLDRVEKQYSVDVNRVTLMGISNGGHGAYVLGSKYREWFNCVVSMCGKADPQSAERLVPVPVWIFHYSTDPLIWESNSEEMLVALQKAGGNPKFTKVPGFGHYVWEDAIGHELLGWMASQSRGEWAATPEKKPTRAGQSEKAGSLSSARGS
jgi:predicted peptidase